VAVAVLFAQVERISITQVMQVVLLAVVQVKAVLERALHQVQQVKVMLVVG
jgi:hypothetical protein